MKEEKATADMWQVIRDQLCAQGIDLDQMCCGEGGASRVKVVCVPPDMRESVREIGKTIRDQVVMVRIDEKTSRALDEWVQTEAVKSRSEAAALFISEGLRIRAKELEQLKGALGDVEEARNRLREKAQTILGTKSRRTAGAE